MENFPVFSISSANLGQKSADLAQLLAKARQGDEAAFADIYNLYFKKIYQFVYYRVGHKEVAEDLSEDIFLKACGKISRLANDICFEGWLYQIARNTVIDYYREKKSTVALEDIENTLEYEANVVDAANLSQQQKVLFKLLRKLGQEQQLVLKLKFFENLTNPEIAELLHKSEGAIRVIQHRAIQKLQEFTKSVENPL